MTVYVIKNAEGQVLEICSNIGAVFTYIWYEMQEDSFKVTTYDHDITIETKNETYEVVEWMVRS